MIFVNNLVDKKLEIIIVYHKNFIKNFQNFYQTPVYGLIRFLEHVHVLECSGFFVYKNFKKYNNEKNGRIFLQNAPA